MALREEVRVAFALSELKFAKPGKRSTNRLKGSGKSLAAAAALSSFAQGNGRRFEIRP